MRSLETGKAVGAGSLRRAADSAAADHAESRPPRATSASRSSSGYTVEQIHELTAIDPWFLKQICEIVELEAERSKAGRSNPSRKRRIAARPSATASPMRALREPWNATELEVREQRKELGVDAVFNRVDTCAAEFESFTPYLYSSYESKSEADATDRKKVMILGSGPNRIGQGIEFDYCCCHASFALQEFGVESIMVNCNPETVSTDYDTSDRLFFEPLTLEEVLNIVDTEKPDGVIVQFGGQTPLNLALPLKRARRADHRHRSRRTSTWPKTASCSASCSTSCRFRRPPNGTATSAEEACDVARRIGYPVLVRPSYVLGGRAMVIAYDEDTVRQYMREAVTFSQDRPVLIDRFLEDATEVDVDALCDGEDVLIAGIMEHIEEAGVHSGDSSCVLPPYSLGASRDSTRSKTTPCKLARGAERHRPDERAVRDQGRHGLRARSEPARVADRAVRQQSDRRAAAEDRGRPDARQEADGLTRLIGGTVRRAARAASSS